MKLCSVPRLIFYGASLFLVGCSEPPEAGLQDWMAAQRNNLKPTSEAVTAPKKFSPQEYAQEGGTEPFSFQKLVVGLKSDLTAPTLISNLLAPELNRRRQALEAFPLDMMSYVGSLQTGAKKSALLRVDKLIYQVEPGAYLGQNYGKITEISESGITLREIVQDSAGEWIERQATLQLQETK